MFQGGCGLQGVSLVTRGCLQSRQRSPTVAFWPWGLLGGLLGVGSGGLLAGLFEVLGKETPEETPRPRGTEPETRTIALSFLSLFWGIPCFFSLQGFPCFLSAFSFFSRDFRGSVGIESPLLRQFSGYSLDQPF